MTLSKSGEGTSSGDDFTLSPAHTTMSAAAEPATVTCTVKSPRDGKCSILRSFPSMYTAQSPYSRFFTSVDSSFAGCISYHGLKVTIIA